MLATGQTMRLDFELSVGDVREQVRVKGETPLLRAESASLGAVIENDQVVQLPLNGRTFITLATLAPGVALPPGTQLPRINGGRPRTNEYLFDGISVLQPEPGQVAYFPIIDAIQEFKIESNSPPAEFGRFNGGVINLTTKSGANAFHGNAFEFFRNNALNGTNYFQTALQTKPDYDRSQFGGTAGGPLVKDHTFFFVDYQGQRQTIGRTVTSTVPTLLQRQGVFTEAIGGRVPVIYDPATTVGSVRTPFPGNAIPVGRIDPVSLSLLQRYPLPTAGGTANNFSRTVGEVDDQDQWDVRIDHRFPSNRDSVFGRLTYFRDGFVPVTPLPEGSGVTTGTLGPQDTTAWAFASNYQRTFSNSLLNELRIGQTSRTRGAFGRAALHVGRQCPEHPRHSLDGEISEYAADVPDRRLPAARVAGEYRVGLPHQRVGSRRLADVGQRAPFAQDGIRLAMGTPGRRPAALPDRIVHVQQPVHRPAQRRPTRARRSPASSSARSRRSRSICSSRRFRSARTSRSISSRTTGSSAIA